jgi:hypothetical protein
MFRHSAEHHQSAAKHHKRAARHAKTGRRIVRKRKPTVRRQPFEEAGAEHIAEVEVLEIEMAAIGVTSQADAFELMADEAEEDDLAFGDADEI